MGARLPRLSSRILDRLGARQTRVAPPVCLLGPAGTEHLVKAMFFAYLVVIVAGCGACIAIGLLQQ
jgi:hypothetical protein